MRAMILAAGRGERMGTLTQQNPKPLLRVAEKYLIEHIIEQLAKANILDIVINVSYFAEQMMLKLGDGSQYGVRLLYSHEKERLETGGGIVNALPLLGDKPFLVVSADIITDYDFKKIPMQFDHLAHLVMVDNPKYHLQGDYCLQDGRLHLNSQYRLTFGSIGVFHPKLFANSTAQYFRLNELLLPAVQLGLVSGEHFKGMWFNIGTPSDLIEANNFLSSATMKQI